MLRALASYFFGGIEDETPEAPIECETREVNDWLVVNLPDIDQIKDSINLNEDDDTYDIDDKDVRDEMDDDDAIEVDASDMYEMEEDEDDILLSVSFLMMPRDGGKISSEFSNDHYSYESRELANYHYSNESRVSEHHLDLSQVLRPLPKFWEDVRKDDMDSSQEMDPERNPDRFTFFSFPLEPAIQQPVKLDKVIFAHKFVTDFFAAHDYSDYMKKRGPGRHQIVSEFDGVRVKIHTIDLTPPPMYSKSYVNHRHPEKLLNHDILQRIKELEPEQQAVQRSAKKMLTRGQLNRQNKNYMYETSTKRNRRSNRQRNHSGANNNRKC